jgi:hypothetical protein
LSSRQLIVALPIISLLGVSSKPGNSTAHTTSVGLLKKRTPSSPLRRPGIPDQFEKIGFVVGGPSRQELPAFVKEQIAAWAAAARDAGIQPQ